MGINQRHADEVRMNALGIGMRNPIADGCESGKVILDSLKGHTHAKMVESSLESEKELGAALRKGQSKLDQTLVHEKKNMEDLPAIAHEQLAPIDEKCDTRIDGMSLTKISEKKDYYSLSFTRANGE